MAWACLGALGHQSAFRHLMYGGRLTSPTDCITRALEYGFSADVATDSASSNGHTMWCLLGRRGGGEVNGHAYSARDCFMKATAEDSGDALAWIFIGQFGGGTLNERSYTPVQCAVQARRKTNSFDELCAQAGCRNPFARLALGFARRTSPLYRRRKPNARSEADESQDEELDTLPFVHAREDEYPGAVVRYNDADAIHAGRVEDIDVRSSTGERLYRIRYDDGDLEHYTAAQMLERRVEGQESPWKCWCKNLRGLNYHLRREPCLYLSQKSMMRFKVSDQRIMEMMINQLVYPADDDETMIPVDIFHAGFAHGWDITLESLGPPRMFSRILRAQMRFDENRRGEADMDKPQRMTAKEWKHVLAKACQAADEYDALASGEGDAVAEGGEEEEKLEDAEGEEHLQ